MFPASRKLGAVSLLVLLTACADHCEDVMGQELSAAPAPQAQAYVEPAMQTPAPAMQATPAPAQPAVSPFAAPTPTPEPVALAPVQPAPAAAPAASPFAAPAAAPAAEPAPVALKAMPVETPVATAPQTAPASADKKPLVIVRFNQIKHSEFKATVRSAISQAEQAKPGLHYDIVSYVPVSGDSALDQRQAHLALRNQKSITDEMLAMGVSPARITVRSRYTPKGEMGEQETHIYVK